MPYKVLKGTFKPAAGFPDGDSVRFAPDDPTPLFTLPRKGRLPRINSRNKTIQLRYEGVDSLEKQAKEPFASDATKKNLELIGITRPTDEVRGYILANQIGPNGRPISFVYAGEAHEEDGSEVFLEVDRMKESINYRIIVAATAYPLYYDTLYNDLRDEITSAAIEAEKSGLGFWSRDMTEKGVEWDGAKSLPRLEPIFPKLWRRLEKYTQEKDFRDESDTLEAFKDYLETEKDGLMILSESRFTDLDSIVEVEGDIVRLPYKSYDLVFFS